MSTLVENVYELQLNFLGVWRHVGYYASRDDAHWAAAKWRAQYGRPTSEGDPFRVVEVCQAVERVAT